MASKVQLCNIALSRLAANTITSLTDNTPEARLCNTFFDEMADQVMIEGSWSSTIKRVGLAQTTNTPIFGYTYEYQLPVNPFCLKVLNIDETTPGSCPYRIEGDKLLIESPTVKIRYIARITDTQAWDPYLTRAFVSRLTAELAYQITGDNQKTEIEMEKYMKFVTEGLVLDGQQGSKDFIVTPTLTEDR